MVKLFQSFRLSKGLPNFIWVIAGVCVFSACTRQGVSSSPAKGKLFIQANSIVKKHCASCHEHSAWREYKFEDDYIDTGLINRLDPDPENNSVLFSRLKLNANAIVKDMPEVDNGFGSTHYQVLKEWIKTAEGGDRPCSGSTCIPGGLQVPTSNPPRLSDKLGVTSLLRNVFGASAGALIDRQIAASPSLFKGNCDPLNKEDCKTIRECVIPACINPTTGQIVCATRKPNCFVADSTSPSETIIGTPSVLRTSQKIKTCSELVYSEVALTTAIQKVDPSFSIGNPITRTEIKKAWQLFHPGKTLNESRQVDDDVLEALEHVISHARDGGGTENRDGYRYLFLTLCSDVGNELL